MNKYKRGRRLSIIGLVKELEASHYVFWNNRPVHWGWCMSMTFRILSLFAASKKRGFYKAIETNKNKKEK